MSKTNYTLVFLNTTIHSYKEDKTVDLILSFLSPSFSHHISETHHLLPALTVTVSELGVGWGSLQRGSGRVKSSEYLVCCHICQKQVLSFVFVFKRLS